MEPWLELKKIEESYFDDIKDLFRGIHPLTYGSTLELYIRRMALDRYFEIQEWRAFIFSHAIDIRFGIYLKTLNLWRKQVS